MPSIPQPESIDQELIEAYADLVDKPLAYVYYNYPWGEGELAGHEGPDVWQREVLLKIEEELKAPGDEAVRIGVASGNGIGKCSVCFVSSKPRQPSFSQTATDSRKKP